MNFSPELTALQGVLISADNKYSFCKLTARGGNEKEIEEVKICLKKFLIKEKYASDNSIFEDALVITRKFAFYLILNADLPILESMVEKDGIDFLIWTIPTVPMHLMCEIMWALHMDQFISEIISFCCPQLALDVAKAFANHMKYFNPMESVVKVKLISAALYKMICRLNFFNVQEKMVNSALDTFQKYIKYFSTPPNVEKLKSIQQNQLYKYLGETLHSLLQLIYECIEEFAGIQMYNLCKEVDIYMLTYIEEDVAKKCNLTAKDYNNLVLDCLHKCHEALLDLCKELVMGVSVDIFCTWSEFEENGKSMQTIIGELSYKLRTKIMSFETMVDHPVVQMLEQISCKPIEVEDIINNTSTMDITENIKNSSDKSLWVRALLNKNNLCQELTLVEDLILNLNVLKEDDFSKLYYICVQHLKNYIENKEKVKLLAIKTFQHCDINTKHKILEDTFTQNCFSDEMETIDFKKMMTEIFNKFIATPDTDLSDILSVFIQSPKHVYNKIFFLATENTQQCDIMGRIMKYLEKYSNYYYKQDSESCVIKTIQNFIGSELDCDTKQNNFVNFVSYMKNNGIIAAAQLLLLVIMPNLYDALINKNLINTNINMKMLHNVYTLRELLEYRAPMLAMIAQVLDVVRWKIHTFSSLSTTCLESAIKLQTSIMETYQNSIPENESSWLKSKLKNINPLNMYYYKALWNPPGETYFEILTGIQVDKEKDIETLSFYMSQILCSTILNEWYQLWDSLSILENTNKLDIFHNALHLVSSAERENSTEATRACLLYCYRNFILTTRYKYLTEPVTNGQVLIVINKIATITNLMEEDNIEGFQSVCLPLLAYIAEKKNDYTVDIVTCLGDKIKNDSFASLINKLFTNGTV